MTCIHYLSVFQLQLCLLRQILTNIFLSHFICSPQSVWSPCPSTSTWCTASLCSGAAWGQPNKSTRSNGKYSTIASLCWPTAQWEAKSSSSRTATSRGAFYHLVIRSFLSCKNTMWTSVNSMKSKTLEITSNITVIVCLLNLIYLLNSFKSICSFWVFNVKCVTDAFMSSHQLWEYPSNVCFNK